MFPIVQDQWLNIFLLNRSDFSYYTILYFLSGFLFPILVIKNSLKNFYDYNFYFNKYEIKNSKFIFYPIFFTILALSILIIRYFKFSLEFIIPQIDLSIYFDIKYEILAYLIVMILLLINTTKRFLKKLFLINFFIIFFVNWLIYFSNFLGIEIYISKYISNNAYYQFNNLNLLNILYLFIFELFYYLWTFISYKNNLSDWSIPFPKRIDLIPISKITIFYLGVIIYYFIFNSINQEF